MSLAFGQTIKAINSEWDYRESGMSMDMDGNHFRTFYIVAGEARNPTLAECLAIADYLDMRYSKGVFYKQVY